MVVIELIAVLAWASGPTAIAQWAAIKEELLASVLPMPHGAPCKDVFRRVLMALRPEAFRACFAAWVRSLREEAAANSLGALHLVTVWATEYGLSLGQVACDEKSNEITAIPQLLKLVDVSGDVVTIDAMGCHKEIAGAVVAARGDFVLALKRNQETLHQAVVDHVLRRWDGDFAGDAVGRRQTEETSHGRRESRMYIQVDAPKGLPGLKAWRGLTDSSSAN